MARAPAGVVGALWLAGCLSAPPAAVGTDGDGDAADAGSIDAACQTLPAFAPFSDNFATGDLSWAIEPKPGRSGPGAVTMIVTGGELLFEPGSAADDHAWLQTGQFDFSSGRVAVRVTALTTDGTSEPYLGILGPTAEERMFRYDGTHIHTPGGRSLLYLDGEHVWWQVRGEEGLLTYETSGDGSAWNEIETIEPGFDIGLVQFEVGINVATAGLEKRGAVAIDDLNLAPLCGS